MSNLNKNFRWFALVILFLACVLIWYAIVVSSVTNKLKVAVLNVGQGDAIFIESPTKRQVLVDGGPNRSVLSALGKEMPFFDRSIDLLMVSNSDKDHIAGLINVLSSYKVGAVLIPGTDPSTEIYKTLIGEISKEGATLLEGRRGEIVELGGGAYIQILFPDRDPSGFDTNTGSLIARLVYGETSVLLTGDAPSGIEDYLVELEGDNLESDILKVAHHGSKNSISQKFFGVVNPQMAAISVGAGNTYGHPNKETLDALSQFGIKTLRTDEVGTIRFFSDGVSFKQK